ncbi:MAG: NAD(+) synthase [Bacteroidales bacterium]|nr:NAD(+) synthase [Bacteroidales bacterium]
MMEGYFRVAACVPTVNVADVEANVESIIALAKEVQAKGAHLAVFPEMCVTGYTCGDLFHNRTLLEGAIKGIETILSHWEIEVAMVVGAPLELNGSLYNCAWVIFQGQIIGIVPKTYLPNYNEFYEKRWWAAAPEETKTISILGKEIKFGKNLIFQIEDKRFGVEICEDLWAPVPPSCSLAMAGAEVIVNLSASDDLIGKYNYLRSLIEQQSARCLCGYVYAGAGFGESSTDLVFDGKAIIAENGKILASNKRWQSGPQYVMTDIDLEALRRDRMHLGTFHDCAVRQNRAAEIIKAEGNSHYVMDDNTWLNFAPNHDLLREVSSLPFVPQGEDAMAERCDEIINIQAAGLAKRLDFIRCKSLVVGISGGLDSTLALLVAVKTFDRLGLDRKGIIGITMPGYGTSKRTKTNAMALMEQLGITMREIPIGDAVAQHFKDIDHDPAVQDVTYENSQARERTQILMDVANQTGGIVLGTGDLSELALGWATYNGDHMSMYGVNASIPKTLVRHLVRYFAQEPAFENCRTTLLDIIDTPISPELIPTDKQGNIAQKTEDLVGPYELHDFFLYYMLRYGFAPKRVFMLAQKAFVGLFDDATIKKWMRTFYRRFFQQQFKRSCLPDGPKVGSVCLSPRGDWRMPSDASAALWLKQVDAL